MTNRPLTYSMTSPMTYPVKETLGVCDNGGSEEVEPTDRVFSPLVKLPKAKNSYVYPAEFEGAFAALPQRHVPHPKAAAYKAWRARTSDVVEVFQLEAASMAYADEIAARGLGGGQFVKQAATFFGAGGHVETYFGVPVDHQWPGAESSNSYADAATGIDWEAEAAKAQALSS